MEGRVRWFLGLARNSGGCSLPIIGTPCEVPEPRKMNLKDISCLQSNKLVGNEQAAQACRPYPGGSYRSKLQTPRFSLTHSLTHSPTRLFFLRPLSKPPGALCPCDSP